MYNYPKSCNPLCKALSSQNLDQLRQALASKPKLNKEDPCGYIPLHYAIARVNNLEFIKLLIDAGADAKIKNQNGCTPLHTAYNQCPSNCDKVAEILIAAGGDLNVKNMQGYTPVHCAVRRCSLETAKKMFDSGVDIHTRTIDNQTLLHLAAVNQNNILVKYLVDNGIDVNAKDDYGRTPLHCVGESTGSFRENERRRATFYYAYMGGAQIHSRLNTVELLLKLGADPNALNIKNETPLQVFAKNSKDDVMELLVNVTRLNGTSVQEVVQVEASKLNQEKQESDERNKKIEKDERDAVIGLLKEIKIEIADNRKKQSDAQNDKVEKNNWEMLEQKMKNLLLTIM